MGSELRGANVHFDSVAEDNVDKLVVGVENTNVLGVALGEDPNLVTAALVHNLCMTGNQIDGVFLVSIVQ